MLSDLTGFYSELFKRLCWIILLYILDMDIVTLNIYSFDYHNATGFFWISSLNWIRTTLKMGNKQNYYLREDNY